MSNLNPDSDWLKELSDTLWQIRMVSQETGGIFNSVVDTGLKLIQKIQALTAATTALTAINSRLASGELQRSFARVFMGARRVAHRGANFLEGARGYTRTGRVVANVMRGGGRLLRGAANIAGRAGMATAGASAGAVLATGGIALAGIAAWKALKTGFSIWSREHQENLENARKRASAAAGAQARRAQLNNRLGGELEAEAVKNIYAIEQKRAENAKALHRLRGVWGP